LLAEAGPPLTRRPVIDLTKAERSIFAMVLQDAMSECGAGATREQVASQSADYAEDLEASYGEAGAAGVLEAPELLGLDDDEVEKLLPDWAI
jgi:hypothetical protein